MILDADCHISSSRHDSLAILPDDLLQAMDRAQVDRALIWLKPPYDKNIVPENRAVYEAVRSHPDRFVGFGWANPRLGHKTTRDTITRCVDEYGFSGIKFNGAQDDYLIDDPEIVVPHVASVVSAGLPVAFHVGVDFPENTHPTRLGRLADQFPEGQFLMVHMGGAGFPALDRSALEVAGSHPNIHIIGSAIHERAILSAIETLGPERVSFGSDMPFFLMHARLALYNALLRDQDADARRAVLGGNMLRILGRKDEVPASR